MIELPAGDFMMGAPADEFRRNLVYRDGAFHKATPDAPFVKTDEGPQHRVTVDLPIAMARDEITYAQWSACVADGGCAGYLPETTIGRMGPVKGLAQLGPDHPVVLISYVDAQAYVSWLNDKTDSTAYRLPTEAEWEYAARAGSQTRFAQGDDLTPDQANFSGEQTAKVLLQPQTNLPTRGAPVPVSDLAAANAWGLRHMSGNAGELTLSCYSDHYAGWASTSQWLTESAGASCERSLRGGSFANSIDILRVAWRGPRSETLRSPYDGFRVVKQLTTP